MDRKMHHCGTVAVMGPPNAGKSTLVNALVGQKVAIVTSKPQTTRNQITGIMTTKNGQAIFIDTPGITPPRQLPRNPLNKIMSQAAWQTFASADAIMIVLDSDLYIRHEEFLQKDMDPIIKSIQNEIRPIIVVVNKVDLFHDKSRMLPLLSLISSMIPNADIYPISAIHEDGIEELRNLVLSLLPQGDAIYPEDQTSTLSIRFLASEIIREKLFNSLFQELPYSVAVEIENWEESKDSDQIIINAVIYVSRPSHKAIVIGKNGQNLKKVGTDARKGINELTGKRVHLELWVKVRENWTADPYFLHENCLISNNVEE